MEKLLIQKFPTLKHSLQSTNNASFFFFFTFCLVILVVNKVTREEEVMNKAITKLAQKHHNSVSKHT
jgi:hypothetical protein